jgi:hypothetical protein
MTLREQPRDQLDHKACDTAVPGMRNVAEVLQRIVHGLAERTLPQEQGVPQAYHTMLPVLADVCQECTPLREQDLMQSLGDRASGPTALPPEACGEPLTGWRSSPWPGGRRKARSAPSSWTMRGSVQPKNPPIEVWPRLARPAKTVGVARRGWSPTARGVASIQAIPVPRPVRVAREPHRGTSARGLSSLTRWDPTSGGQEGRRGAMTSSVEEGVNVRYWRPCTETTRGSIARRARGVGRVR